MLLLLLFGLCIGANKIFIIEPSCNDTGNCTAVTQKALEACSKELDGCTVQFTTGRFLLNATQPLQLHGAKNFTLAGSGPTATALVLDNVGPLLQIDTSVDVIVSGFSVDMLRLPYTLCFATVGGSTTLCQFNETQYPFTGQFKWLGYAQAITEYDIAHGRMGPAADIFALDDSIPVVVTSPGMLTISHALEVNKWYIIRHVVYGNDGIKAGLTTGLTVSDVTLHALAGMGVVASHSSNIHITRLQVAKAGSRPMSICADGIHLTSCRGGFVVVENSLLEGQGDDGLNIPSMYQDIQFISVDRRTVALGTRGEQPQGPAPCSPGDTVVVYSRRTFLPIAQTTIHGLNRSNLVLNDPLPASVEPFDLLWNANNAPNWVLLRNSTFRNNRARGALLKASNLLAENNTFEYTTEPGIQAYPDGCGWFEGNVVTNWTLLQNRFVGTNFYRRMPSNVFVAACVPVWNGSRPTGNGKPTTELVFRNLSVIGNYFEQTQAEAAVGMYGVEGLTLRDNVVLYQPASKQHFECTGCSKVVTDNNRCGPSLDSLSPCTVGQ